ncbi:MAG: pirin family protein [Polyangiaceae bacterium]
MKLLRSSERGHANHGWLDSFHTFSFADYHNPNAMGFRALRVINEDRVAPGEGFPTHGHRDMEIVSYVLSGALEHKDSMGTGSVIRHGDVQRMSAGTGVMHSEYNHSKVEPVHFLQIWITPDKRGHAPSYEQKTIAFEEMRGKLRLRASSDGREDSLSLHQDVALYSGFFADGETEIYELADGRHGYVHVARGTVKINDTKLGPGDAAMLSDANEIRIEGIEEAEVLLFDLA